MQFEKIIFVLLVIAAANVTANQGNSQSSKSRLHYTDEPCYSTCTQQGMYCREETDGVWCLWEKNCDVLTCDNQRTCKKTEQGSEGEMNVFSSCISLSLHASKEQ